MAEPEAFVPLNAEVAPQLALFGGGPRPPVKTTVAPPAVAPGARTTGLPAPHREINTWCNREVGANTVREATIDQLERSIEVPQAKLDEIARRRAKRAS
ncbi:MAG TPA: hypothetical protein VNA28_03170 [Solirubrobacteraceae bacterium]|nr:hypothetical protein [Solirubrobacteraceae bacterium]